MYQLTPKLSTTVNFPHLKNTYKIDDHRTRLKARFYNIRTLSIYQLGCQILNSTSILHYNVNCGKELFTHQELPYKLFSWDKRDYMVRRHTNMAWFDLLRLQISPECMEIRKFKVDLNEIRRYISLILHNYLQETTDRRRSSISIKFNLMEYLRTTLEFVDYDEKLVKQNERLSTMMTKAIGDFFAEKYFKPTMAITKRDELKRSVDEQKYILAASNRYAFSHLNESVNKSQIFHDNQINALKNKITKITKQINDEKFCNGNILSIHYMEIDNYHDRLIMWSNKYDTEYDAICTKISVLSSKREHLRTHHQFLKEEIIRFREEIKRAKRRSEIKRLSALNSIRETLKDNKTEEVSAKKGQVKKKIKAQGK